MDSKPDQTITYPNAAVEQLADQLMDRDWNLRRSEAVTFARDVVIDVTRAVDSLRAWEAEGR